MLTIWEFPLVIETRQEVILPAGANILKVAYDHEDRRLAQLCLWAIVNPDHPRTGVEIIIVGNGHDLPHVGSYINSVVDGSFVWHIFTGPGASANFKRELHYDSRGGRTFKETKPL